MFLTSLPVWALLVRPTFPITEAPVHSQINDPPGDVKSRGCCIMLEITFAEEVVMHLCRTCF